MSDGLQYRTCVHALAVELTASAKNSSRGAFASRQGCCEHALLSNTCAAPCAAQRAELAGTNAALGTSVPAGERAVPAADCRASGTEMSRPPHRRRRQRPRRGRSVRCGRSCSAMPEKALWLQCQRQVKQQDVAAAARATGDAERPTPMPVEPAAAAHGINKLAKKAGTVRVQQKIQKAMGNASARRRRRPNSKRRARNAASGTPMAKARSA